MKLSTTYIKNENMLLYIYIYLQNTKKFTIPFGKRIPLKYKFCVLGFLEVKQ